MSSGLLYGLGIMSGTSLDGLDLCYVEFKKDDDSYFKILKTKTFNYDSNWKKKLSEIHLKNNLEIKQIDLEFAQFISEKVLKFKLDNNILKLDFISSHGHTVKHKPPEYSIQIGNGKLINELTKVTTINNFRTQDIVLGGQGAPLVPIGDKYLFGQYKYCLNLGGIANISFKEHGNMKAYDICGCNILINTYSKIYNKEFDKYGILSSKGKIIPELIEKLNAISYNFIKGPKSLDKISMMKNNYKILDDYISKIDDIKLKKIGYDILATVVEHISYEISKAVNTKSDLDNVLITGGGAKNIFLVEQIKNKLKCKVVVPKKTIVDFKEALIFAYMGKLRLQNKINCLRSVTGANIDHSTGHIYKEETKKNF
tara:strand:- start:5322 stop:6431 length:1110 start_codon:yes stop_codon:yes gene_type:complete